MAKNLLIVESPAKAKTINKYLGKDFTVLASYGHVRDLVPKEGAVDPDSGFAMTLRADREEREARRRDRQGRQGRRRTCSWQPTRTAKARRSAGTSRRSSRSAACSRTSTLHRVVFTEITPRAIKEAMAKPRAHRQRPGRCAAGAPRARLPGRLQPVAGAVAQGPERPVRRPRAVAGAAHDRGARGGDRSLRRPRVLVDRGRVRCIPTQAFTARLAKLDDKKFEQFTITDGDTAEAARQRIVARRQRRAARHRRQLSKERKRRPSPPVHHLDPAAGSRAQARLHHQAHHARGAEAL